MERPGIQYQWENTYIMEPEHNEKFLPSKVTAIIEAIMTERLADKEYSVEDAKLWTIDLCNDIKAAVKEQVNVPRYKIMCQVLIGKNDGQGIRVASKCLWDHSNDNHASYALRTKSSSRLEWSLAATTSRPWS